MPQYLTTIPSEGTNSLTTPDGSSIVWYVQPEAPFAIHVWNMSNPTPDGGPFLYQPHDLTGADWADQATAQAFADTWVKGRFSTPPAASAAPAQATSAEPTEPAATDAPAATAAASTAAPAAAPAAPASN
jgi:hypothetical protein